MLFLIYQLMFPFVAAGILFKLVLGGRGAILKETRTQLRQRLGLLSKQETEILHADGKKVVWMHAASIGEVNAAAPLIAAIAASSNAPNLLLTTSTAAGLSRARSLKTPPALAALAPADFYPLTRIFLKRAKPDAFIIIETELWPATIRAVSSQGIPIAIANGRLSERTFRRYRWIGSLMRPLMASIRRAAVQTEEDAARFEALGLPKSSILVAGNLKYDLPPPDEAEISKARELLKSLGWSEYPLWVAGSAWPDETGLLLSAFKRLRLKVPNLRMVLVPRHPERCGETRLILESSGTRYLSTKSIDNPSPAQTDCLLVEDFGRLRGLYGACGPAFVGGTFNSAGGHNLFEPALAGKPVVFGPNTKAVEEAAKALESSGGGRRAPNEDALVEILSGWFSDKSLLVSAGKNAQAAAHELGGASQKTLDFLRETIQGTFPRI